VWWATAAMASLGTSVADLAGEMVEEIGPRPAGSRAGDEAQRWVARELSERGWRPSVLGGGTSWATVYSCRPGRRRAVVLFLAHTDSVHAEVPGANDNAAAVSVLLHAIEKLPRKPLRTVCVAFPDAEEIGLRGSETFASFAQRAGLGGPVDQVVALDLVGVGRLTYTGLGTAWGSAQLQWLLEHAPAEVPWVYRGVSWAWPHMERSDHRPFADRGMRASHLLARGPSGVYWAYHTRDDTVDQLQPATLARATRLVRKLARAPRMPRRKADPAVVVPSGQVLDGRVVQGGALVGIGSGLASLWADRSLGWVGLHAAAAALAFAVALVVALGGRSLGFALAEPALLAAWCAWGAVWVGWPWPGSARAGRALALVPAVSAGVLWWQMGPIMALPLAVSALAAALAGRLPAVVLALPALWPAGYLVRPDAVRELAFHGLVPAEPLGWAVAHGLLTLPLIALVQGRSLGRGPLRLVLVLALVLGTLGAVAWGWSRSEQQPPYERGEVLWPARPLGR